MDEKLVVELDSYSRFRLSDFLWFGARTSLQRLGDACVDPEESGQLSPKV